MRKGTSNTGLLYVKEKTKILCRFCRVCLFFYNQTAVFQLFILQKWRFVTFYSVPLSGGILHDTYQRGG